LVDGALDLLWFSHVTGVGQPSRDAPAQIRLGLVSWPIVLPIVPPDLILDEIARDVLGF